MAVKRNKAAKTKNRRTKGRYYIFGSYDNKADALHAASVLRKDKSLKTYVKKNTRTGKWDTMHARVKKA